MADRRGTLRLFPVVATSNLGEVREAVTHVFHTRGARKTRSCGCASTLRRSAALRWAF